MKDVLTHLPDWKSWNQLPAQSEQIYRRHRRKSVATVMQEFEATHERTLAAIQQMTNEELTTLEFYSLSDYLRANTASHYRWAEKKIRRWLRDQPGPHA